MFDKPLTILASTLLTCTMALGAAHASEAPSTVSAAAPDEPSTSQRWEVRASDVTLAKLLERWAQVAGHKLKWDASRNFLIGAPDVYIGTFEGAVQHLLSSPGIRLSDYPLEACIYANTPPLVRITRQGEQSRECTATGAPAQATTPAPTPPPPAPAPTGSQPS